MCVCVCVCVSVCVCAHVHKCLCTHVHTDMCTVVFVAVNGILLSVQVFFFLLLDFDYSSACFCYHVMSHVLKLRNSIEKNTLSLLLLI